MASTNPNKVSMFSENPMIAITAKVPINDTGTATSGIMAILQDWRNTITTITTRITASRNVS